MLAGRSSTGYGKLKRWIANEQCGVCFVQHLRQVWRHLKIFRLDVPPLGAQNLCHSLGTAGTAIERYLLHFWIGFVEISNKLRTEVLEAIDRSGRITNPSIR